MSEIELDELCKQAGPLQTSGITCQLFISQQTYWMLRAQWEHTQFLEKGVNGHFQ